MGASAAPTRSRMSVTSTGSTLILPRRPPREPLTAWPRSCYDTFLAGDPSAGHELCLLAVSTELMNWRRLLGILSLLCLAFGWGYVGPDAAQALTRRWNSWRTPKTEAPPTDPAPPAPALNAPNAAQPPVVALQHLPGQPPIPPGMRPPGAAMPPPPVFPNAAKPESLGQTLDTIRPGQVPPDQISQRNAYFERLSESLKQANNAPPPAPANGNPQLAPPPAPFALPPPNIQPPAPPYAGMPGGPEIQPLDPGTVMEQQGGLGQQTNAPEEEDTGDFPEPTDE